MREEVSINGVVLREKEINENDKLLTVFTEELGKISVYSKGTRSMKNKNYAGTMRFCYSSFELASSNNGYVLKTAVPIKYFMELSSTLEGVTLAAYFTQCISFLLPDSAPESGVLSLILNGLYCLTLKDFKTPAQIKGAFEFKLLCILGYCPEINKCGFCGNDFDDDIFKFLPEESAIVCNKCAEKKNNMNFIPLRRYTLYSLRYISRSNIKRCFLFTLPDGYISEFSAFCEKYMQSIAETSFDTLEYYKKIIKGTL